jgi:alpha-D-ribose 1-methylphosphonate 5-triphosphate synthase subunit PhnL
MTATVIGVGFAPSMTALYHHATASLDLEDSVAVAELMREIGIRGIAVVSVCIDAPALG